jgi:hypothetical protein
VSFAERENFSCPACSAELLQSFHELASPLKQIAASIGRFRFVADSVRQGHFADLLREAGLLRGPVAKGGTETVNGNRATKTIEGPLLAPIDCLVVKILCPQTTGLQTLHSNGEGTFSKFSLI